MELVQSLTETAPLPASALQGALCGETLLAFRIVV